MSYKRKSLSTSSTNLNPIMFFKVYLPDRSSQQLILPSTFVKRLNGGLPPRSIIACYGKRIWSVDVKRVGKTLSFENGWSDFVKDSSLVPGDFLVFSYLGAARFNVKIYGQSGCEKINAYAVKECKREPEDDEAVARDQCQQTEEHGEETNELADEEQLSSSFGGSEIPEENEEQICRKKGIRVKKRRRVSRKQEGKDRNASASKGRAPDASASKGRAPDASASNGRAPDASANNGRAPDASANNGRAPDASTKCVSVFPHFKIGVLPVYITHGSLNIPMPFAQKYLKVGKTATALQVLSKSWPVTLTTYANGCCKISSGWLAFVRDNYITEGDICLFELIDRILFTFRVTIFPCPD